MASSCLLLIDERLFLCGVCGEVFTLPVTTPCGHTFCWACLQKSWDEGRRFCPTCKKVFPTPPEMQVNTMLAELSADFKRQQVVPPNPDPTPDPSSSANGVPGGDDDDVLCDICAESKDKAVKSCLRCLCSFCERHLEPHRRVAGLRRHPLVDPPVAGLEGRLCRSHRRAPDAYCRTERAWLCRDCVQTGEHRLHHVVTLEEECGLALAEPPETVAELQGAPAGDVMDATPRRGRGAARAASAGRRRREAREGNGGRPFFQTAPWKN